MKKIAVFASGSGTNFEAIVRGCNDGRIQGKVVLLVCDNPSAFVVQRAKQHGIESFVFNPKDYGSKSEYEAQIVARLDEIGVDLICLAGYMRILAEVMLERYEGSIINIHPSLLPAFKGANAIKDAFEYGVKVYGVTIHYVDKTMDGGEIIAQKAIGYGGKNREVLEQKIHEIEHELYVQTIDKVLTETVKK